MNKDCPTCNGTGKRKVYAAGKIKTEHLTTCDKCQGKGWIPDLTEPLAKIQEVVDIINETKQFVAADPKGRFTKLFAWAEAAQAYLDGVAEPCQENSDPAKSEH